MSQLNAELANDPYFKLRGLLRASLDLTVEDLFDEDLNLVPAVIYAVDAARAYERARIVAGLRALGGMAWRPADLANLIERGEIGGS